jgi:microcystin-dependent protein
MSDPYVGEIRMFGGTFAPLGWALCDGRLLPISENETLFQIIGTTYGGDGESTFALPDLRGRLPIGWGQGPGLTNRIFAEMGGSESVTITTNQLPNHTHAMTKGTLALRGSSAIANRRNPSQAVPAVEATGVTAVYTDAAANTTLASSAIAGLPVIPPAGGTQPTGVLQPALAVTFIISLFGIFPSQT